MKRDKLGEQLIAALLKVNPHPYTPKAEPKPVDDFVDVIYNMGVADGRWLGRIGGRFEGEVMGQRRALKMLLAERGFYLDANERTTIERCDDRETFDQWIVKALTASSVGEVLEDKEPRRRTTRTAKRRTAHA